MYLKTLYILTAAATLLLGACSSTPERIDVLDEAREVVAEVETHPNARQAAGDKLADAREALQNAEHLQANNGDYDEIYHEAYMALRHAEIARERIYEANTREQIEDSEAERSRVLLLAREAETDRALERAEDREREADVARTVARARELEAEAARQDAAAHAAAAEQKAYEAELAEQRANAAVAEQERLKLALLEMEAEKTDRGYVLTLGDILLDTDKAVLKPGAQKTMDNIAEFMREYPEHRLLIEGHTDSRGSESYNVTLSESRANAVRLALMDRGIDPDRLEIAAMGERYPLASNDTSAGMQENRRVEVIFSDADGDFPAAAIRTVSND